MEPILCGACEKPFTPKQSGRPYCSRECYYESLRTRPKKAGVKYRTRTVKGHPIAPPGGVVGVARLNLYERIGEGPHPCNWCNTPVNWNPGHPYEIDTMNVDHLDWDTANDDPSNLVPSCRTCNGHRRKEGDSRTIQPGDLTMIWSGSRTRAVRRTCVICGAEFLTIPAEVRKGKGLYCSRSCARSKSR